MPNVQHNNLNNIIHTDKMVFEFVRYHLLSQSDKSMDSYTYGPDCRYRQTVEDMHSDEVVNYCAVGCLITDKNYSNELEGEGVKSERVMDALQKSLPNVQFTDNMFNMLSSLQMVHDSQPVSSWYHILQDAFWNFDDEGNFFAWDRVEAISVVRRPDWM